MSIVSGILQADATKDAAEMQKEGAQSAADVQWRMYKATEKNMLPWLESGRSALSKMNALRSGELDWRTLDPAYDLRVKSGMDAISAAGSATGDLGSGTYVNNLMRFGQDIASEEYQNVFNRLAAESGVGQVQSQSLGNAAMQTGSNIGNYLQNAMNAIAQGRIASSNAITGGARGAENMLLSYYLFGDK